MLLQYTNHNMLLSRVGAPINHLVEGDRMQISLYVGKIFNEKNYWPGLCRT